jgi:F420-non-reducing hydrogenase iron-sulfur subunit
MMFEPKIIAFCCNWCAYAGADLAGVSRIQYPPSIRIVRVMCSGRVDPVIALEVLKRGADGFLLVGCHPGDCHYQRGNFQTERKIKMLRKVLEKTGMSPGRLKLEWVSASEGDRLAKVVTEFTDEIRALGRSPLPEDADLGEKLDAAERAVGDFRLRALVSHEIKVVEEGNVYGDKKVQEEIDELIERAIEVEYDRWRIWAALKSPTSAKDVAKTLGFSPQETVRNLVALRKRGRAKLERVEGTSPLWVAVAEEKA